VRAGRPRPSRSPAGLLLLLVAALLLGACATVARPQPLPPDAEAARVLLERRWQGFSDLRTLANLEIRRGGRVERLAGVLLLRSPASLRFEALSPFGPPILLVGAGADGVTVWEVLRQRAYLLPSSPDANKRWLGLALGAEDLVALLSGHVLPIKEPVAGALLPPDESGPSLTLTGDGVVQRIWLDPASGQAQRVSWTGGKQPLEVAFSAGGTGEPASGLTLRTPDGKLEVRVRYHRPQLDSGFDPELLRVTVPQGVEIQDFR